MKRTQFILFLELCIRSGRHLLLLLQHGDVHLGAQVLSQVSMDTERNNTVITSVTCTHMLNLRFFFFFVEKMLFANNSIATRLYVNLLIVTQLICGDLPPQITSSNQDAQFGSSGPTEYIAVCPNKIKRLHEIQLRHIK